MEDVCRVAMDHTGPDGWNYLCQLKWTSVAEGKKVPLCAGMFPAPDHYDLI